MLLEFDGKRIILPVTRMIAGCVIAWPTLTRRAASCASMRSGRHHGSDRNLSKNLLDLIDCDRYLISTSGARHAHPNEITMARIFTHGGAEKEIIFNYRTVVAPPGRGWLHHAGVLTPYPLI